MVLCFCFLLDNPPPTDKYKINVLDQITNRDLFKSSDAFTGVSIVAFMGGASQIAGAFFMWWTKDEATSAPENSNASVNISAANVVMTTMTPAVQPPPVITANN